MKEDPKPSETPAADEADRDAIVSLLKRSMGEPETREQPSPALLRGVQRKIRQRSKGKFFSDGWSTADSRFSYAVIALAMLFVIGVAYFALTSITIR